MKIIKKFNLFLEDLENQLSIDEPIVDSENDTIVDDSDEDLETNILEDEEVDLHSELSSKIEELSNTLDKFETFEQEEMSGSDREDGTVSPDHDEDELRIIGEMKKLTSHLKGLMDELANEEAEEAFDEEDAEISDLDLNIKATDI